MTKIAINKQKKKELHDNLLKTKPLLNYLPRILAWFGVIASVTFWVLCKINDDWFISNNITDPDYGEQNTLLIGYVIAGILIIFEFLAYISLIAGGRISGKQLSERVNESMTFSDGEFEYGYQNFAGSTTQDRVIKKIDLDKQKQIVYDSKLQKITFKGIHSSTYYSDYKKRVIEAGPEDIDGEIILFDYFEPSLLSILKTERIEVKEV